MIQGEGSCTRPPKHREMGSAPGELTQFLCDGTDVAPSGDMHREGRLLGIE